MRYVRTFYFITLPSIVHRLISIFPTKICCGKLRHFSCNEQPNETTAYHEHEDGSCLYW